MPPTTRATVCSELERMARNACSTCMASSRVGSRISACAAGPRAEDVCSISTMGMRKPSVLPVPVCAVASTSRPARAGGMQPACTGVGISNLLALSRAIKGADKLNCENMVVKIILSSVPGTAFPRSLHTRNGTWRHTSQRDTHLLIDMRKGEPKVVLID